MKYDNLVFEVTSFEDIEGFCSEYGKMGYKLVAATSNFGKKTLLFFTKPIKEKK